MVNSRAYVIDFVWRGMLNQLVCFSFYLCMHSFTWICDAERFKYSETSHKRNITVSSPLVSDLLVGFLSIMPKVSEISVEK